MESNWLPSAAVLSSVLVFVASGLRLLFERSAINRFAVLAKARADLPEACEATHGIDLALVDLSRKIALRESSKDFSRWILNLAVGLSGGGVLIALLIPVFNRTEQAADGLLSVFSVAVAAGALVAGVASVAAALIAKRELRAAEDKAMEPR